MTQLNSDSGAFASAKTILIAVDADDDLDIDTLQVEIHHLDDAIDLFSKIEVPEPLQFNDEKAFELIVGDMSQALSIEMPPKADDNQPNYCRPGHRPGILPIRPAHNTHTGSARRLHYPRRHRPRRMDF